MISNYDDEDDWSDEVGIRRAPNKKSKSGWESAHESLVPPMNEKPYYVKRLERTIGNRSYNAGHHLQNYNLPTLKLMDAHHRPSDFASNRLRDTNDQLMHNALLILSHQGNKDNSFDATITAYKVIKEHHILSSENISQLPPKQVVLIAAASKFLVETNLHEFAPPRLTHYVMSRADDVEHIISYVKQFFKRRDDANSVDLEHLTEYLDNGSPALRDGGL
jgi:hypothetical protein